MSRIRSPLKYPLKWARRLRAGEADEPGDYRDSIEIRYARGGVSARVGTVNYKAFWLEYGSIHNPEHGYAQRTLDEFGGGEID
jgi:hypothetical protein